jgi:hypothetical protein
VRVGVFVCMSRFLAVFPPSSATECILCLVDACTTGIAVALLQLRFVVDTTAAINTSALLEASGGGAPELNAAEVEAAAAGLVTIAISHLKSYEHMGIAGLIRARQDRQTGARSWPVASVSADSPLRSQS